VLLVCIMAGVGEPDFRSSPQDAGSCAARQTAT
jgi:hypothetical protein